MTPSDATSLGYDVLHERLRREIDVALNLAQQLQTRAQVVASSVALLLTAAGVAVGANESLVKQIQREGLEAWTVATVILSTVAVLLGLAAAYPMKVDFSHPDWFKAMLGDERVHLPVAPATLASTRKELDLLEADILSYVLKASRRRGWLLVAGLVLMGGAVMSASAITVFLTTS